MLAAWEICLLAVTLRLSAAGVVFLPKSGGRGQYICSFILVWLMGIGLAIAIAAMIKPEVAHPGWGAQGEKNYNSFTIINVGFWLTFLGSLMGTWFESLRRAPRRSGYGSGGRSQIRLLPIPRQ